MQDYVKDVNAVKAIQYTEENLAKIVALGWPVTVDDETKKISINLGHSLSYVQLNEWLVFEEAGFIIYNDVDFKIRFKPKDEPSSKEYDLPNVKALVDKVLDQTYGYTSGPGFEAAQLARAVKYPDAESTFNGTYLKAKLDKFIDQSPYNQGNLSFSEALRFLKAGHPLAREGWNGKGMFVYFVPAKDYPAQTGVAKSFFGAEATVPYNAYFAIKNPNGTVSTWVPSVNDIVAEDWSVVDLSKI